MHQMIVGQTMSGKSTLAKLQARTLLAAKHNVAVLDPLADPDWRCTFRTDDIDEMDAYLKRNRSVFLFVDESGEWFNEGRDKSFAWFTTKARHFGHSTTLIAQRYVQIPTTMRDQCHRLYAFTQSASDGDIMADEWNKDVLRTSNTIPQFHFYVVERFALSRYMRIGEDFNSLEEATREHCGLDRVSSNAASVVRNGRKHRTLVKDQRKE